MKRPSSTNPLPRALHDVLRAAKRAGTSLVPLKGWQRMFPKDVVSLFYHLVSDEHLPHAKYYFYQRKSHFDADMLFLKNTQRFLGYDELEARRRGGMRPRENGVLVTFDDGFAECFTAARDILLRYAVPCAFFVPTDFIDNRRLFSESKIGLAVDAIELLGSEDEVRAYGELRDRFRAAVLARPSGEASARQRMADARLRPGSSDAKRELIRWLLALEGPNEALVDEACAKLGIRADAYLEARRPFLTRAQIQELAKDGFTIGAHGRSHVRLSHLDDRALEREIVDSCDAVRSITGQKSVPFAFPYSGEGLRRETLHAIVKKHPFVGLLFDTGGLSQPNEDFLVNRLYAGCLPSGASATGATLPSIMHAAWSHPMSWGVREAGAVI